jgi:hypothetical protein
MTKDQAKQALARGKKIRHDYFQPDEWIQQTERDTEYTDNNGVIMDRREFWKYRNNKCFEHGWKIVK